MHIFNGRGCMSNDAIKAHRWHETFEFTCRNNISYLNGSSKDFRRSFAQSNTWNFRIGEGRRVYKDLFHKLYRKLSLWDTILSNIPYRSQKSLFQIVVNICIFRFKSYTTSASFKALATNYDTVWSLYLFLLQHKINEKAFVESINRSMGVGGIICEMKMRKLIHYHRSPFTVRRSRF